MALVRPIARTLSLLLAAAPFGAGLIRAVQTGTDLRLVWMAVAAFIGGFGAMTLSTARRKPVSIFAFSFGAFILATALSGVTGFLLGARSGPGVWMIAIVFGLCWAACALFDVMSRRHAGHPTREP